MPKKGKGKKSTPPELDFIFDRELLDEDQYRDFWANWWKSDKQQKEALIDKFSREVEEPLKGGDVLPIKFKPTIDKEEAEKQAKTINGYIVRRDKNGRFNKRGRHYQAVKRGKRK